MTAPLRWRLTDDDGGQAALFGDPGPPGSRALPAVEYLHVRARRIISEVPPASRMPFRYTINAYRGCTHACVYCFARPTHTYLGMDGGADFERRIVVKANAVELLRAELRNPRWGGDHIAMGTNTDPYQPCEGRYRLTRGIVEALIEARNPFSILTKSTMILRDLDLLAEAAAQGLVRANLSIGTLDEAAWRATEPGTPPPRRRMDAVARLVAAGVPCGVLVAPVLPGISDAPEQLEDVVRAACEAGADTIAPILLHLRPGVRELFEPWLAAERPELVDDYGALYAGRSGYAPSDRQRALSALVHGLAERHRVTAVGPRRSRGLTATRRSARPPAPAASRWGPEQLRLGA
jgi:DNA repair photolyase